MSHVPGPVDRTTAPRLFMIDKIGAEKGPHAQIDSANAADAAGSPTYKIRRGVVLGKTSGGKWVNAANTSTGAVNANVVVSTQASVSASETADSDWASAVITISLNGVTLTTVTLGAGDDTDAEVVTALNGNAIFAAHCVADVNATLVRIRTLAVGEEQYLLITCDLATAFGASGTAARGTTGDYVVASTEGWLQDSEGNAVDAHVETYRRGHFDESQLLGLTPEAKTVLASRGSQFG